MAHVCSARRGPPTKKHFMIPNEWREITYEGFWGTQLNFACFCVGPFSFASIFWANFCANSFAWAGARKRWLGCWDSPLHPPSLGSSRPSARAVPYTIDSTVQSVFAKSRYTGEIQGGGGGSRGWGGEFLVLRRPQTRSDNTPRKEKVRILGGPEIVEPEAAEDTRWGAALFF